MYEGQSVWVLENSVDMGDNLCISNMQYRNVETYFKALAIEILLNIQKIR